MPTSTPPVLIVHTALQERLAELPGSLGSNYSLGGLARNPYLPASRVPRLRLFICLQRSKTRRTTTLVLFLSTTDTSQRALTVDQMGSWFELEVVLNFAKFRPNTILRVGPG